MIIFIEHLLCTALRAPRATTRSSSNAVTGRCRFRLTGAEAFPEGPRDLPKVNGQ